MVKKSWSRNLIQHHAAMTVLAAHVQVEDHLTAEVVVIAEAVAHVQVEIAGVEAEEMIAIDLPTVIRTTIDHVAAMMTTLMTSHVAREFNPGLSH